MRTFKLVTLLTNLSLQGKNCDVFVVYLLSRRISILVTSKFRGFAILESRILITRKILKNLNTEPFKKKTTKGYLCKSSMQLKKNYG